MRSEGRGNVEGWVVRVPASSANLGPAFDAVAVALGDPPRGVRRRRRPGARDAPGRARVSRRGRGRTAPVRIAVPRRARASASPGRRASPGSSRCTRSRARSWRGSRADMLRDATRARRPRRQRGGGALRRRRRGRRPPRACGSRSHASSRSWCGSPTARPPTASARRLLPEQVRFDDAVFNVGRTALLVAALAAGEVDAMRIATEDRLHQSRRLARARDARARDRRHARRRRVRGVALGFGPVGRGVRRPRPGRDDRGRFAPDGRAACSCSTSATRAQTVKAQSVRHEG